MIINHRNRVCHGLSPHVCKLSVGWQGDGLWYQLCHIKWIIHPLMFLLSCCYMGETVWENVHPSPTSPPPPPNHHSLWKCSISIVVSHLMYIDWELWGNVLHCLNSASPGWGMGCVGSDGQGPVTVGTSQVRLACVKRMGRGGGTRTRWRDSD